MNCLRDLHFQSHNFLPIEIISLLVNTSWILWSRYITLKRYLIEKRNRPAILVVSENEFSFFFKKKNSNKTTFIRPRHLIGS